MREALRGLLRFKADSLLAVADNGRNGNYV